MIQPSSSLLSSYKLFKPAHNARKITEHLSILAVNQYQASMHSSLDYYSF